MLLLGAAFGRLTLLHLAIEIGLATKPAAIVDALLNGPATRMACARATDVTDRTVWAACAAALAAAGCGGASGPAPLAQVRTVAGEVGTCDFADATGAAARFNVPSGIAVSRAGDLYVADFQNFRVRRVTRAGAVTTLAGGAATAGRLIDGRGAAAGFAYPSAIAIDDEDRLYVYDRCAVRALTDQPFAVHLHAPVPYVIDGDRIEYTRLLLAPYHDALGLAEPPEPMPPPSFEAQIEVLLDEGIEVASFAGGLPPDELLAPLLDAGVTVIGTATHLLEALVLEEAGVHIVVAQGAHEAPEAVFRRADEALYRAKAAGRNQVQAA